VYVEKIMDLEKFRGNAGPSLIALSVVGFVLIQFLQWLPLGFLTGILTTPLWVVVVLAMIAGIALTVLKFKRN